jgi:hypothetical protein
MNEIEKKEKAINEREDQLRVMHAQSWPREVCYAVWQQIQYVWGELTSLKSKGK